MTRRSSAQTHARRQQRSHRAVATAGDAREGALDPGERPAQHVGGVHRGSPLNLLKRRPDRKRLLALDLARKPRRRSSLRTTPGCWARPSPTIPTPTPALNSLPRRTRQVTSGCGWSTGSVGHDAANHVRRGRLGEEQASRIGRRFRTRRSRSSVAARAGRRAGPAPASGHHRRRRGRRVAGAPPPRFQPGPVPPVAGSSAEAVTRTWTPSSFA